MNNEQLIRIIMGKISKALEPLGQAFEFFMCIATPITVIYIIFDLIKLAFFD